MRALAMAAAICIALASPANAWSEGPRSERALNHRIKILDKRKDRQTNAIRKLREQIEQRKERRAELRRLAHVVSIQDGWVATLVRLRECESHSNYKESPNEGVPGHDGAYQYDEGTWANAYGYSRSYLAPWYLQDARTALYLANGESGRWACY